MNQVIAIDGPAASGKSTVSRRVAARLGFLYVDSGALYRGMTWAALREGADCMDQAAVLRVVETCPIEFFVEDGAVRFAIDGIEPGDELRTDAINEHVSPVAANPGVRVKVVAWLRDMLRFGHLVVEGRDIGTKVFPDARVKFYLDADPEERARRRHGETAGGASVAQVGASLKRRDRIDSGRKVDPLKTAEDACVIDSTDLSIDDVVELVVSAWNEPAGADAGGAGA